VSESSPESQGPVTKFITHLAQNAHLQDVWEHGDDDSLRQTLIDNNIDSTDDQDAIITGRNTWDFSLVRDIVDREAGIDDAKKSPGMWIHIFQP